MEIIKRIGQVSLAVVIVIVMIIVGIYSNFRNKDYVDLETKEPEIAVFYRSDCPTCKKIYPKITIKAAQDFKNPRFVNLVNKENHKYIKKYYLKSVPTTVNLKTKKQYAGADLKKIDRVMNPEQIGFVERIKIFWNSVKD